MEEVSVLEGRLKTVLELAELINQGLDMFIRGFTRVLSCNSSKGGRVLFIKVIAIISRSFEEVTEVFARFLIYIVRKLVVIKVVLG